MESRLTFKAKEDVNLMTKSQKKAHFNSTFFTNAKVVLWSEGQYDIGETMGLVDWGSSDFIGDLYRRLSGTDDMDTVKRFLFKSAIPKEVYYHVTKFLNFCEELDASEITLEGRIQDPDYKFRKGDRFFYCPKKQTIQAFNYQSLYLVEDTGEIMLNQIKFNRYGQMVLTVYQIGVVTTESSIIMANSYIHSKTRLRSGFRYKLKNNVTKKKWINDMEREELRILGPSLHIKGTDVEDFVKDSFCGGPGFKKRSTGAACLGLPESNEGEFREAIDLGSSCAYTTEHIGCYWI